MGPDHSQIEIYEESKHGIMFQAQERLLNLDAPPKTLTTRDMFIPTCATCHMSGLNGLGITHDPSERLSYYLANAVTEKRPNYAAAQAKMKQVCSQCHAPTLIDRVYTQAEAAVQGTNDKVRTAQDIVTGLRKDGIVTGPPFSQPIDFIYFDLWHYDGRTSKHGAFMGGADFVQWHGNYPMLQKTVELQSMAAALRREHGKAK
jgi:hydroxylamine dehydrogenase